LRPRWDLVFGHWGFPRKRSSMDLLDSAIYPLIGEQPFRALVAAFYGQIPTDELLGPLYDRRDLAGAEQRLGDFLIMRFGGPDLYLRQRGHPRLRMRHHPFPIDQTRRDRWVELMERALMETEIPADVRRTLGKFFREAATFLINVEPAGK